MEVNNSGVILGLNLLSLREGKGQRSYVPMIKDEFWIEVFYLHVSIESTKILKLNMNFKILTHMGIPYTVATHNEYHTGYVSYVH